MVARHWLGNEELAASAIVYQGDGISMRALYAYEEGNLRVGFNKANG